MSPGVGLAPDPHTQEIARLDALVAELRHALVEQSKALARAHIVVEAAIRWSNSLDSDAAAQALFHAVEWYETREVTT